MKTMMSSWVENIEPDDEVKVEIIYPPAYVEYNMSTIKKYASGISYLCKGAAVMGEDETDFIVWGITALQTVILKEALRRFGIELEHEHGKLTTGERYTWFYADIRRLKEILRDGEFEGKVDM